MIDLSDYLYTVTHKINEIITFQVKIVRFYFIIRRWNFFHSIVIPLFHFSHTISVFKKLSVL